MKRKRENINGDSPATQSDLSSLAGEMTRRFDEVYEQMATKGDIARLERGQENMKDDIARLERGQQAMLAVLESIDAHFEDHRNVPERVARLERSEFGRS